MFNVNGKKKKNQTNNVLKTISKTSRQRKFIHGINSECQNSTAL